MVNVIRNLKWLTVVLQTRYGTQSAKDKRGKIERNPLQGVTTDGYEVGFLTSYKLNTNVFG